MKFLEKIQALAVIVGSIIFVVESVSVIWSSIASVGIWQTIIFWQTMPLAAVPAFFIKITIISILIVFPVACVWHFFSILKSAMSKKDE